MKMQWLVDNWALIMLLICVIIGCHMTFRKYYGLPREDQIKAIKEWLLFAVTEAEKVLGSGTGKLKLRYVYDAFITKFPWAAKVVPFVRFSTWVDEVLIDMRKMLETNTAINNLVNPSEEQK